MSNNQESGSNSASAAAYNGNYNYNANSTGRAGGDKLRVQGGGGTANTQGATAAATSSATPPQRPRHHFTRSLSELSSPLRLRRQSQSQSQSPASGHNASPSQNQIQNQNQNQNQQGQSQAQSRRNNSVRDNRDYYGGGPSSSTQAGAASTSTTTSNTGPTANGSANLQPTSPPHSPRLTPLGKSRTTGGLGGSLASAAVLTGNYSLAPHDPNVSSSNTSSHTGATSTTASPNTSRRPSVHTNYNPNNNNPNNNNPNTTDFNDYRTMQSQQPLAHDSGHHHHHHHHRHHHHSLSTSNTAGYMSSHSTTIAALAAAATAVAAASPTTQAPVAPNALARGVNANADPSEAADPSQDELLLQHQQERQASLASGTGLSASGLPIDPAAVRAAASALERMQREQSRSAARVLQSAVTDLDGLSTETSQRLDAAYGSVLTRLGSLQDTVLALRSLAAAARATNRRFTAETEAITNEISQQVEQLEGDSSSGKTGVNVVKDGAPVLTPADQQHRLEQLSERVHRGRKAIQDLAERVETARSRVQRWEKADQAWQERTRTRLKVLWVIVSSVGLTLVVLLAIMMRHSGGGSSQHSDAAAAAVSEAPSKPNFPPDFPDLASMSSSSSTGKFHLTFPNGTAGGGKTKSGDGNAAGSQDDGDPLQRLFDEL